MPLEKVFGVTGLGQFGDWLSSSGNKIDDVRHIYDGKHIYLLSDLIPEIVKFDLNLGGIVISSNGYNAPEYPNSLNIDFLSVDAPGHTGWTLEQLQDFEIECADHTFNLIQSFKCRVPNPIQSWNIISAGVRASIQSGATLDVRELRVLKMEKLLKYVV